MRHACFAVLIVLLTVACKQSQTARTAVQTGPPPLVVASDLDNLPFAGVDENGTPIGRDVEMMEAIGVLIDRPIEWRRLPFETLLPVVQAGQVDVVCATIGITPERARKVAFSRPYFETVIAIVVRTGAGEPARWEDLAGHRIAAGAGTTSERAVRMNLPDAELVLENKDELAPAERLMLGDVDAIAMDGPAADALVAASGGSLATFSTPLARERYALALPRDRAPILSAIDAALLRFEKSGRLASWDAKYGLAPAAGLTR